MSEPTVLQLADTCRWVFKSGWARGMTCRATAWFAFDGEPRCRAHRHRKAVR